MVKISVEVRSGAARFSVAVRAQSIPRAVNLVHELYPGDDIRVKFPIDPESFFVEDPATPAAIAGFARSDQMVA